MRKQDAGLSQSVEHLSRAVARCMTLEREAPAMASRLRYVRQEIALASIELDRRVYGGHGKTA